MRHSTRTNATPATIHTQLSTGFTKGTPVPPNKDDFGTVVSDPGITLEQYNRLLGVDNAIRVRIQMQYTDAYGGNYETEICLGRLVSGAIQYCDGSHIK